MMLSGTIQALAEAVDGIDPARTSGSDAARLMKLFERGERLCAAGKALMAARAAECQEWSKAGARSPGDWLAQVAGTSVGTAQRCLDTAKLLADQPEVAEALRSGEISPDQAAEISTAVAHDPKAAPRLLHDARTRKFKGLKESCRAVRLAAKSAEEDQANSDRQRASRYCRTWTERDGSGRVDARMDPVAFTRFMACLRPFEDETFSAYRKAGTRDSLDRYRADALLALAEQAAANRAGPPEGDKPKTRVPAKVIVVIDRAALLRGHAEEGERCEIEGFGPVPVAVAREIMDDAFLAAVVADGVDIRRVVHLGRQPTQMQMTALQVRDPRCVVPMCERTDRLETHHDPPFEQTHHTTLDELSRPCDGHHDELTYQGAILSGEPGNWQWQPPPFHGPFDGPPDPDADPTAGPFDDPPPTDSSSAGPFDDPPDPPGTPTASLFDDPPDPGP